MPDTTHAIENAITYISTQHTLSYPDAVHVMGSYSTAQFVDIVARHLGMPIEDVRKFSRFRCEGRFFHLAMITEALQDAVAAGHRSCEPLVEENSDRLVAGQDGISWRYFPGFEPLPYDADSLAQIARVLLRSRRAHPARLTDAFELAAANAWEDGAISTFLTEDPDRRALVNKVWGRGRDDTGRDPEVVANLLYTALLYERQIGPSALTPLISRATNWLAEQQQAMGFWRASWYVGTCYSTYAAVRHLSAVGGYEETIERAVHFLLQAEAPDPLNRALAMLAIAAGGGRTSDNDVDLLLRSQFPDGSWEAIPLLDNHARIWGSRTVTTALCLKALLTTAAW
ncbi:hypothetical protein [Streptomyces sp. NPDC053427]|uniref:hypothetical protein n=1 Tax=Streptomyces sp. NPDC053427 TaxID=3365701 RepID=UPI0037D87576